MRTIADNMGLVFRQWKYIVLAVSIALLFYAFNALIVQTNTLASTYDLLGFIGTLRLSASLITGYSSTVDPMLHIGLIVTSVLLGLLFSLITYKTRVIGSGAGKHGALSTVGIFFGVLAPGCAACGVGLLSTLGLGVVALHVLPFKGLELSILSVAILVVAIASIARNLTTCRTR